MTNVARVHPGADTTVLPRASGEGESGGGLPPETLHETVHTLLDVIGLIEPATHHHTVRISDRVAAMCERLDLSGTWEYTLAALLSQLGTIALPSRTVERYRRGEALRAEDQAIMDGHPESAHNLVDHIPGLERVARMVRIQNSPPPSRPLNPDSPNTEDRVAIGGHLLDVAIRYEQMLAAGRTPAEAIERLREGPGTAFRFRIIDALAEIGVGTAKFVHRQAELDELEEGMYLDNELRTIGGLLLLAGGTQLTRAHLDRVRRFARNAGIEEPIDVLISDWD